ncbi:MAG: GNAT family N-acetyltransferase [Candidatus Latescibacteria bacterium]|nr:GNAT family N-acetyltransferase [Candidatus Latescibacterota bacterium]
MSKLTRIYKSMSNESGSIYYTSISVNDVEAVAEIHRTSLDVGILLNNFGTNFLVRMYFAIIQKGSNFGYVAKLDGKAVGFIIGSVEEISFTRCLDLFSVLIFLLNCLRTPHLLFSTVTVFLKTSNKKERVDDVEISHFAVDKKFRGLGVGSELISLIEQKASEDGFKTISTRTYNERLITYYCKQKKAAEVGRFHISKNAYVTLRWNL